MRPTHDEGVPPIVGRGLGTLLVVTGVAAGWALVSDWLGPPSEGRPGPLVYYLLTGLVALIVFVAVAQGTRMLLAPKGSDFSLPKPVFAFGIFLLLGGTGALLVGLMAHESAWLSLAVALGGSSAIGGMYLLRRRIERPVVVPAFPGPVSLKWSS